MTREEIDALTALEAAATPGEWEVDYFEPDTTSIVETSMAERLVLADMVPGDDMPGDPSAQVQADAAFIAALRNAAPLLLARAREADTLRERVNALEEAALTVCASAKGVSQPRALARALLALCDTLLIDHELTKRLERRMFPRPSQGGAGEEGQ